jgi:Nucleotidyl transferase AbiEii toxin, Type IV TA system
MVGGTTIALHIGHRLSIDFDLFKNKPIRPKKILDMFDASDLAYQVTLNMYCQLNLICRNVKFAFFEFSHDIPHDVWVDKHIRIPNLLDLAAMKAFALGHRSKWKDYVDLFFILRDHYSIEQIITRSIELFPSLFAAKLFRAQLCYFEGINFSEMPDYLPGYETSEDTIKAFLIDVAMSQ